HRNGEGPDRARLSGSRGARRGAAARARRAGAPRSGGARAPGRVPGAPLCGPRVRMVAVSSGANGRDLAAGGEHEGVGRGVNVLFVVTRLPVPPWRGDQVRAYHHLRLLGPRHAITCAALLPAEPPAAARAAVEALGVRLVVVRVGRAGAVPALARAL